MTIVGRDYLRASNKLHLWIAKLGTAEELRLERREGALVAHCSLAPVTNSWVNGISNSRTDDIKDGYTALAQSLLAFERQFFLNLQQVLRRVLRLI
jgi:hypothetical protein